MVEPGGVQQVNLHPTVHSNLCLLGDGNYYANRKLLHKRKSPHIQVIIENVCGKFRCRTLSLEECLDAGLRVVEPGGVQQVFTYTIQVIMEPLCNKLGGVRQVNLRTRINSLHVVDGNCHTNRHTSNS